MDCMLCGLGSYETWDAADASCSGLRSHGAHGSPEEGGSSFYLVYFVPQLREVNNLFAFGGKDAL